MQLNNPVGGMVRGSGEIVGLYERIFRSSAHVHVTFGDIVEFAVPGMVVFAGRETGQFDDPTGRTLGLRIRTTRVFAYDSDRWGQVHHHGSIDDPGVLRDYQEAGRGEHVVDGRQHGETSREPPRPGSACSPPRPNRSR